MGDTALNSYPIGGGKIIPVDHTGPKSYTTGGETLGTTNNMTGISVVGLGSLDMVLGSGSLTDSGTYYVFVQPSGTGSRKTFKLLWYTSVAGSGTFTGTPSVLTVTNTDPTITTATGNPATAPVGVITGALAQTAGATGITGVQAPVLTMASYTPAGTITATGGLGEVSPGTDLSGETVRIGYVGR